MTLKNNRAHLLCYLKLSASFRIHWWIPTRVTVRNLSQKTICLACHLEIWQMTLKNNGAPLLCYLKLCASFRSHWLIQTGVTVWKRPIWVKFDDFFSRVTLKFDGWPLKIIGHLFYATSSFVHHFIAIGEFKIELQSGNAQFGSNRRFLATWPWNLGDDLEKQKGTSSMSLQALRIIS